MVRLRRPTVNYFSLQLKQLEKAPNCLQQMALPQANIDLVKDIYPGPASSNIFNLISGDTTVYFMADDGTHGSELWKSNGTKQGTQLVKDIAPGLSSTFLNAMVNVHDKLFFTINDILWQSDGTKKGTNPVNDVNLAGVSGLGNLTAFGNNLAFTAFAPTTGQELYTGNTGAAAVAAIAATDILSIESNTPTFNTSVYPNPAHSKATLKISGNTEDVLVTIADMNGRIIWRNNYNNQSRIELPVEKLTAGMYLVTVKHIGDSRIIKLVKE